MRNKIILLIMLILCTSLVSATSVWDCITHGYAKTNFCWQDGDCVLNNLSVVGGYFNVSVTTVNYNVTGTFDVDGDMDVEGEVISDISAGTGDTFRSIADGTHTILKGERTAGSSIFRIVDSGGHSWVVGDFYDLHLATSSAVGSSNIVFHIAGETNSDVAMSIRGDTKDVWINKSLDVDGNITVGDRVGIGTTTPSHELDIIGGVEISNGLWVDGNRLYMNDAVPTYYYGVGLIVPHNIQETLKLMLNNNTGLFNPFVIGGYSTVWKNYDHARTTDPTTFFQSGTDPDTDNTEYVSITHNTSNALITSGKGSVVISPDLDVTGNITTNQFRAEVGYHNHTGTTLAFADGVWQPLFFTRASTLVGFNFTGGFLESSNLTCIVQGQYDASYRLSGSGQNNHIYFSTILVNGVEHNDFCGDHKQIAAGGDIIPMGNSCFLNLTQGDDVQVAVMDYGASGNGDYYSGNLNLVRIGEQ